MLNLERFEAEAHNLGFSFLNILPFRRSSKWSVTGVGFLRPFRRMAYLSNARECPPVLSRSFFSLV